MDNTATMTGLVERFLEAARAELGAADNTVLAYGRDLADFGTWLSGQGLDWHGVGREDIENYLISLQEAGLSQATRARRLSAVRQFFRFALDEGWRDDNPAAMIHGPRRARRLPANLSEADVERLLKAARNFGRDRAEQARNACLFELLYATGMRVSELVSLPVAAARGNPRMLLVQGKGGKERMVPLSPPARRALKRWLKLRDNIDEARTRRGARPSAFLFPGHGKQGHLTRVWFHALVKKVAQQAGLGPDDISPHSLRHAFATHMLAHGADLRVIQTLLGHADIATTEIYTHVLDERLKELVLKRHPLA